MLLLGDCTVNCVQEKEYEGRKYYKLQVMAKDNVGYSVSCAYDIHPKPGDILQMVLDADSNWKPTVRVQKVK